jgi:hypothetical protein
MKVKQLIIAAILLGCIVSPTWAKGGKGGQTPILTEKESSDLIFLREEEKLARDVYLAMFDLYQAQIFSNISVSEQRHMDSVKGLLDKYGLQDPVVDDTPGAFSDPVLAGIYAQLIEKGSVSLKDALEVGVIIEEMDIHDIEVNMLPDATQTDIKQVLANLLAGSYNHLDAFTKQLDALVL